MYFYNDQFVDTTGTKIIFNKKTHVRAQYVYTRVYYAGAKLSLRARTFEERAESWEHAPNT